MIWVNGRGFCEWQIQLGKWIFFKTVAALVKGS
jgi:hypothetical protein